MNRMRYPTRFLMVVGLCMATLAAIGYHNLMIRGRRGRVLWADWLPLLYFVVAGALAAVVLLTQKQRIADLVRIAPDFETGVLISVGLMVLSVGLAAVILLTRARPAVPRVLVVALVLFDLVLFRLRSGYAPAVPLDSIAERPPVVEAMEADARRFRVLSMISMEDVFFSSENGPILVTKMNPVERFAH